jgi:hypothetical protein
LFVVADGYADPASDRRPDGRPRHVADHRPGDHLDTDRDHGADGDAGHLTDGGSEQHVDRRRAAA